MKVFIKTLIDFFEYLSKSLLFKENGMNCYDLEEQFVHFLIAFMTILLIGALLVGLGCLVFNHFLTTIIVIVVFFGGVIGSAYLFLGLAKLLKKLLAILNAFDKIQETIKEG